MIILHRARGMDHRFKKHVSKNTFQKARFKKHDSKNTIRNATRKHDANNNAKERFLLRRRVLYHWPSHSRFSEDTTMRWIDRLAGFILARFILVRFILVRFIVEERP